MAFHKAGQGAIESSASTARTMLGQGATEYLIMLAAILIIALVALALLGFFPGVSSDAKISQSTSYWMSEAKPVKIIEHHVSTNGTLTLVIQNVDATGTIRIQNITTTGASMTNETKLGSGETKTVTITGTGAGNPGEMYEFPINISYVSPNGVNTTQYGLKPIVGKYG